MPLFSMTLLPALNVKSGGANLVAYVLSEALAVSELYLTSNTAIKNDTFDPIASPRAPEIRLSTWMPDKWVNSENVRGRALLGLPALACFDDTPGRSLEAAELLRNMHSNSNPDHDALPVTPVTVNSQSQFSIPSCSMYRLLAPNRVLYSRMMNMAKQKFIKVYNDFFYEIHQVLIAQSKCSVRLFLTVSMLHILTVGFVFVAT